jgi:hypothetical protein
MGNRPRREADNSRPPSADVKNAWLYTSTPHFVFMEWHLVKHGYNFTFIFTFTKIGRGVKLTIHLFLVPRSKWTQYVFIAWYLVKHRDNFAFTFTFSLVTVL